jgi:UDP-galactopyranose mutase
MWGRLFLRDGVNEKFDYLIVGAGFAGLVLAERLTTLMGRRCLLVDKRDHIGGNCYDEYDEHGVLVHKYGPHYFRTNSERIRDYLSNFTEWLPVNYKVLSHTDGRFWSFPVNLKTYEQMVGRTATSEEFISYLDSQKVVIENPINSEEVVVSQVGYELYRRFFQGYTLKQWKRHPRELDASVCGRIPIRTTADDRYFSDEFQALPKDGYSAMFKRMVAAAGPLLHIRLGVALSSIKEHIDFGHLIYTGPIDEYFGYCYGKLPYRSLRFERQHFSESELKCRIPISGKPGYWQPALQVNYPNDHEFTRIVELKHATQQNCAGTTIVREYPADYGPDNEPYYPVPAPEARRQYKLYESLAQVELRASFVGRLATYRYYNMDQVVGMALAEYDRLAARGL